MACSVKEEPLNTVLTLNRGSVVAKSSLHARAFDPVRLRIGPSYRPFYGVILTNIDLEVPIPHPRSTQ